MNRAALIHLLAIDPDVADGSAEALATRILALDAPSKRTPILALEERDRERVTRMFERRTEQRGDCIVWTGPVNSNGYGIVTIYENGYPRNTSTHRASWLLRRGEIPDRRLVLDHLCRNPPCVNVDHLELVTSAENTRRGALLKSHCIRGHEMAGDNLYFYRKASGSINRGCRACAREANAARRAAKKLSAVV